MSDPVGRTQDAEMRTFDASDGYPLGYRYYSAPQPKGAVVCLHGIQSHSGWYEYSSQRIVSAGYSVYFADRRGSGRNERERGDAPHADRLINDVVQLLAMVRHECGHRPVLLGLSWGGKPAALTAALNPALISRLVLLYPGIVPQIGPAWWQRKLLAFASLAGRGGKQVPIPLEDPALFTADPAYQKLIREDPVALRTVSVRFALASLELDRRLAALAGISVPVLLMLAGNDQIIDNARTREVVDRWQPSVDVFEYPNARHTLEFESDREAIFDDLCGWLDRPGNSA